MVSPSPHIHDAVSTQSIMRDVLIALVPALIASVVIFGFRALVLTAVCIASCMIFEYFTRRILGRSNDVGDLSAAVTGMLLAFNLPVGLPLWMAILGCFFAIVIVKQLFGGIGQNFANPAIAARIFLLLSFSLPMTTWVQVNKVSGATPLAQMALERAGEAQILPNYLEMFLGLRGGCLGETCALALIIGGIYLIARRVITPTIPLAYIGGVAVLALLFGEDPLMHIMSGGCLIGAIFMATDYTTSPVTEKGKVIFGLGCALLTMIIRIFGSYPEGVSYAILLMNIVCPLINKYTRTKPFGGVQ
ncbi:MAG: RnfABCDGE type electron transport complex subunit D [Oscillospiraceae bacterium]|nr:RnfABCDGE type electron transport complex subunit D [Oscillospiraceae bacterium]